MLSRLQATPILLLCGLPLLWLLSFYAYMLDARVHLGHFPKPMVESFIPGDPVIPLLWFSMLALLPLGLLGLILVLITRRELTRSAFRSAVALFLFSVLCLIVAFTADPGRCLEWFFD